MACAEVKIILKKYFKKATSSTGYLNTDSHTVGIKLDWDNAIIQYTASFR